MRTLRDLVEGLGARGAREAIVEVAGESARIITYAELGRRALDLAAALAGAGVARGEPVILFGPNSAAWVTVRLALAALGAVTIAIDDVASGAELAVLVPDSGARRAFVAAAHAPRLAAHPLTLHLLDGDGPLWSDLLAGEHGPLPAIDRTEAMMLVTTSGTTGTPKGFHLTHANVLANIDALVEMNLVAADDRVLLPLPLHHVYPLTVGLLTSLSIGACVVIPEGVTGPKIVQALRVGRITVMVGVPRLYAALLAGLSARVAQRGKPAARIFALLLALSRAARRRLGWRLGRVLFGSLHRQLAPGLWLMASGGAKLEADLIWMLEALGWTVLSGYGLAETASILTANRRERRLIGSEGEPLRGAEIRIARPDGDGVGEIEARGPSVFAGYRNNPEANRASFTADGWFRTGDLGVIDAQGFIHIAGRVKEMIVLGGGKNVFPEEVEKIYGDHPAIREVAVLEDKGALVAIVVPNTEAIAASGSWRIEDVMRVALTDRARSLASYQRLAGYAISREALPRTRLGKYQRFKLPALYAALRAGTRPAAAGAMSEADRALLASSPAAELWAWLTARYPDQSLSLDLSPQLDLGIDSLEWVTMTLELAERFGVHFSEADGGAIATLRDLLVLAGERRDRLADAGADLAWLARRDRATRAAGHALHALNRALVRGAFGLDVSGIENLPREGASILAVNHLSDLDPFVVAAAIEHRTLDRSWWSGDRDRLFGTRVGRALARASHIFPIDERQPATSLAYGVEVLRRGLMLVWFPESWRSPDGELQRFLPGIGQLVTSTRARVVPARLFGTFEAMPRGARWPKAVRLGLAIGAPIEAEALLAQGDAAAIAEGVRAAVAALEDPRPQPPSRMRR